MSMCQFVLLCSFFFFLMIRQPLRSTLFPYTTLSRSQVPLPHRLHASTQRHGVGLESQVHRLVEDAAGDLEEAGDRSEEHTSELQSLAYLVCRLLLQKKEKKDGNRPPAMLSRSYSRQV